MGGCGHRQRSSHRRIVEEQDLHSRDATENLAQVGPGRRDQRDPWSDVPGPGSLDRHRWTPRSTSGARAFSPGLCLDADPRFRTRFRRFTSAQWPLSVAAKLRLTHPYYSCRPQKRASAVFTCVGSWQYILVGTVTTSLEFGLHHSLDRARCASPPFAVHFRSKIPLEWEGSPWALPGRGACCGLGRALEFP